MASSSPLPKSLLVFETSTPSGGVALYMEGLLFGETMIARPQAHSRLCLRFAEELLAEAGLKWMDLEAVATSHGPGSFTGVRVGLTLAKGIAWQGNLRAVSVSTLEALAWQCGNGSECVVPLLDARIGEVYGAVYTIGSGRPVLQGAEFCCPPEEIARQLPGRALFAGEGAIRYYEQYLAEHGHLASADRLRLTPAATGALALEKFRAGEEQPAAELHAIYLREAVPKPAGT